MNLKDFSSCLNLEYDIDLPFNRVVIDSRDILPGDLFVTIKGERFDGHDFILNAEQRGAVAVICLRKQLGVSIPQLLVTNTIDALVDMAKLHRERMSATVIALTGSNGKTSVKEMIASILPKPSYATQGNLNNHIGVPLSVLRLKSTDRYAVFELGANHLGEIAQNVAIVKPSVALINNIAAAHIGEFGSIEAVAQAKGEIYAGLAQGGTAVVNADDAFAHFWDASLASKSVIRFAMDAPADVHAENLVFNEKGLPQFTLLAGLEHVSLTLQVRGLHNVQNALAAASCCLAVGIPLADIAKGLASFSGVIGRLTPLPGKHGALIIDDTYNANLHSVLAAIDVLAEMDGFRVLVLGDMGELGAWGQAHHAEVGMTAKAKGIDLLFTFGELSAYAGHAFGMKARHFSSQEELARELQAYLLEHTTILVKGSRSARMEKITHQLID